MRNRKYDLTLLEVMLVIVLLVIASSVVGLRMHQAIQKKKFQSELGRFRDRLLMSQKLAIAMQADWKGTLKKEGNGWKFHTVCEEILGKKFRPLSLSGVDISFNGQKVNQLEIDFFANGHTMPEGTFVFRKDQEKVEWKTAELFSRDEGDKPGPLHPKE